MPMPKTNQKRKPRKEQQTFDLTTIMHGVGDPVFIRVNGQLHELNHDDVLLVDRARRKPKDGDYVVRETAPNKFTIRYSEAGSEDSGMVWGIAVALILQFPQKAKRRKAKSHSDDEESETQNLPVCAETSRSSNACRKTKRFPISWNPRFTNLSA